MVKPNTNTRRFSRLAVAVCTFFFLAGQPFLPRLGIEDDESIFGYAFLEPRAAYFIPIRHSRVPLMLMSYLGTLKAWLYKPIFLLFGVNVWSVREPALLAGAAGIWFFYLFLRRAAGERAALIGCGLLAADSMYLLTVCFDWGPVALQHLLLIGGLYLLTRFYQKASELSLAGGFLLWGLAMWDKALAIWMLGAFGVAGLVIFWRQILAVTTFRRVAISVAAFALGALPLIVYNVDKQWATFRGQGFGAPNRHCRLAIPVQIQPPQKPLALPKFELPAVLLPTPKLQDVGPHRAIHGDAHLLAAANAHGARVQDIGDARPRQARGADESGAAIGAVHELAQIIAEHIVLRPVVEPDLLPLPALHARRLAEAGPEP